MGWQRLRRTFHPWASLGEVLRVLRKHTSFPLRSGTNSEQFTTQPSACRSVISLNMWEQDITHDFKPESTSNSFFFFLKKTDSLYFKVAASAKDTFTTITRQAFERVFLSILYNLYIMFSWFLFCFVFLIILSIAKTVMMLQ